MHSYIQTPHTSLLCIYLTNITFLNICSAFGVNDSHAGLFVVAFAIVSEETEDNWRWFLEHLKQSIEPGRKLVFISDRNHGILEGVNNVFPKCTHGYCYKHLIANLKDNFRGVPRLLRQKLVRMNLIVAMLSYRLPVVRGSVHLSQICH